MRWSSGCCWRYRRIRRRNRAIRRCRRRGRSRSLNRACVRKNVEPNRDEQIDRERRNRRHRERITCATTEGRVGSATTTKRARKPAALGALHKHDQYQSDRDDDEEHGEKSEEEVHKRPSEIEMELAPNSRRGRRDDLRKVGRYERRASDQTTVDRFPREEISSVLGGH